MCPAGLCNPLMFMFMTAHEEKDRMSMACMKVWLGKALSLQKISRIAFEQTAKPPFWHSIVWWRCLVIMHTTMFGEIQTHSIIINTSYHQAWW